MSRSTSRVTSDLFLVLTSLAIAFVIWLIAKRNDLGKESFSIPLRIQDVPANITVRLPHDHVQVTATFPQSVAVHVKAANFEAVLDWDAVGDPRTWRPVGSGDTLQSSQITINSDRDIRPAESVSDSLRGSLRDVRFTSIDPSKIVVEAQFIVRPARIVFRTSGKVADGYRFVGPIVPQVERTILLTASPERLANLTEEGKGAIDVMTDKIDLSGVKENFVKTVNLHLPDDVELVHTEDRRVDAQVKVVQIVETRAVEGVTIDIRSLDEDLVAEYSPKIATVTVKAPQGQMKKLTAKDFVVHAVQLPQERDGSEATVVLKAEFSTEASPEAIEKAEILSVVPETLRVKFVNPDKLFRF